MSNNEAADQVVNMSLKGIEMAAKISGLGAKNIAVYLYAVLNDQKKTKGKARLSGMLKSGKQLKIFAVKKEDLAAFVREAKKYGVLYAVLKDKNDIDGMCDIMVRAEDGAKINRIVERFQFATVDMAEVKTEIIKNKEDQTNEKKSARQTTQERPLKNSSKNNGSLNADTAKPSVRTQLEVIKSSQTKKPLKPIKPISKTHNR